MSIRLGIAALLAMLVSASGHASIVAGHDYEVLTVPQRHDSNGSIEVVEFFSWGCPHCYEFYPMLLRWVGALPKDVTFKRVPVGLGHPEWEALARAFYALQVTGEVNRLDAQIFEDIHRNHVWLYDEASITAWVGKHGVDMAKFRDAYRSFSVNLSAEQAEQRAEDYRIPGVPTLAIAEKYRVGGDHATMLKTSAELIVMAREAGKRAGK